MLPSSSPAESTPSPSLSQADAARPEPQGTALPEAPADAVAQPTEPADAVLAPAPQALAAEGGREAPDAPPEAAAADAAASAPGMSLAACGAELAARFPAVFTPGQARPLKLRIQADIQARAPGVFGKKILSAFLHRHTTATAYLKALASQPERIDLDGQPASPVDAEHRDAAAAEVQRRRARRAESRPPLPGRAPRAPEAGAATAAPGAEGGGERPARPPRGPRPEGARRAGPPAGEAGPRPPRAPRAEGGPRPPRAEGERRGPGREAAPRGPRPEGDRRAPAAEGARRPATGAPRPQGETRGPRADGPRRPDGERRAPADRAEALPRDPAQLERANLLRAYETSTLTRANFCALKRLDEATLEAQLAQARSEREARAPRRG
ncbi:ProQ/FINO family protein [Aquariibacter albus]|uniref:ProQ/FINO family protein n=1 Tax=Aquariibacter albus TaxID=2759899 RepID=UPI002E2C0766|nr:ProQ/FINO family protein [Aquariibacter albus]